jgi:DNA processing protein
MTDPRMEQAALLAVCRNANGPWWNVGLLAEEAGSALALIEGGPDAVESVELLEAMFPAESRHRAAAAIGAFTGVLDAASAKGDKLITVLDKDYPTNLRLVYDRPPFLFVRGALPADGVRSLAVVGTRTASEEGLAIAAELGAALAKKNVTVFSGMARGVDGAAHKAAIDAGGITVAVIGSGINLVYPPEHADLAERIVQSGGALVSQFFPDDPPSGFRFPLRNRTMSGLALGTAVIEASHTSGARMQARVALEHGKRVFLFSHLVTREKWAQGMLSRRIGAVEVESIKPIIDVIDTLEVREQAAAQLTLA